MGVVAAFWEYGQHLETVTSTKYLGRLITVMDVESSMFEDAEELVPLFQDTR